MKVNFSLSSGLTAPEKPNQGNKPMKVNFSLGSGLTGYEQYTTSTLFRHINFRIFIIETGGAA